ncbi:MAG: hypothetical protein JXA90_11495, partial [Planctomycetes bacterium]|nr:hypothetical protein [Planctomycetota bacterium]
LKETSHPRAEAFARSLADLVAAILDCGLNEDGVWVSSVSLPDRKVVDRRHAHCWGYLFGGVYTAYLVTGEKRFLEATRRAFRTVIQKPAVYLDDPAGSGRNYGSNAYSDAIESAIVFINRLPDERAGEVIDECVERFLARQRPDGIIEDWYGDGNYVRTALMYALMKSAGTWLEPWRDDLRLGAVLETDGVLLVASSERPWRGALRFDVPRHRLHFRLPVNYPRLNEFPEWFAAEPSRLYDVHREPRKEPEIRLGAELARGLDLELDGEEAVTVRVAPHAGPPYGPDGSR